MHLHRRQFLLGPAPEKVRDDWRTVALDGGLHLSHCPTLPVEGEGSRWLLGIGVQSEPGRPDPAAELAETGELDPLTTSWAGRWVLIADGRLRQDAKGTLGCFYRRIDGDLWVSSSPAVLAALEPQLPIPERRPPPGPSMDWFPAPHSGVESVARLLPTQVLTLGGEVLRRPLVRELPSLPYRELLDLLESRLRTEVANVVRMFPDTWLPLSGGGDSRLILAAAQSAGVRLTAYTFVLPDMRRGDLELPPKLAKIAGIDHHRVEPEPPDPELVELFDAHTARHVGDIAAESFTWRQWEKVTGAVELAGATVGIGKSPQYLLPTELAATPDETSNRILAYLPTPRPEGIREWAQWLHETNDPAINWVARFFIEQRTATWVAAIGQGLDLNETARIHVGNSEDYLGASLALPLDVQYTWAHYDHLFERLAPELLRYPINPTDSVRQRVLDRVHHEVSLYRTHGRPDRYVASRARHLLSRRAARRLDR